MTLAVTNFIHANRDWETLLADAPYYVKTKRDGGFVLLRYDQIRSDFMQPLVRECRGIILDESDEYRPVCVPFFKFGNYGESYVPDIDWSSATVQEKIDGSFIKLWNRRGAWRVSSNGEIDARNAHINSALLTGTGRYNLYDLFTEAWAKTGVEMAALDPDNTYMFELTSPHNRIVVRYDETRIHHIGTRNHTTLQEIDADIGIAKPRVFPLGTLEACIASAKELDDDAEGYVVVDKHYNRVKVKSPLYVSLNHLVQGTTTRGNIVAILQKGEQEEFLAYFPEYNGVFGEITDKISAFAERQDKLFAEIAAVKYETRKDLAAVVTKTECPACLFALMDGKEQRARDWLMSRPADKILQMLGMAAE
ncbi:MAG: hypothetical protein LBC26_02145 [Oscillospiraceae bacterium]|nr:hypothetical protein [Oscillospiraceae bacterium]